MFPAESFESVGDGADIRWGLLSGAFPCGFEEFDGFFAKGGVLPVFGDEECFFGGTEESGEGFGAKSLFLGFEPARADLECLGLSVELIEQAGGFDELLAAEARRVIEVPLDFKVFEFRGGGGFEGELFANQFGDSESVASIGFELLPECGELEFGIEEAMEVGAVTC